MPTCGLHGRMTTAEGGERGCRCPRRTRTPCRAHLRKRRLVGRRRRRHSFRHERRDHGHQGRQGARADDRREPGAVRLGAIDGSNRQYHHQREGMPRTRHRFREFLHRGVQQALRASGNVPHRDRPRRSGRQPVHRSRQPGKRTRRGRCDPSYPAHRG